MFLEHFEKFSLNSLSFLWKVFSQRILLTCDLYSLLDLRKNGPGRVTLGIIGALSGGESGGVELGR